MTTTRFASATELAAALRTAIDVAPRLVELIGGFAPPPGYESSEEVSEGALR